MEERVFPVHGTLAQFLHKSGAWIGATLAALTSSRGATTAEYALILTLVVIILIGSLNALGGVLNDQLLKIVQNIGGTAP